DALRGLSVSPECADRLSGEGAPESYGLVLRGGGETAGVRTEHHVVHGRGVTVELEHFLPGGGVPDLSWIRHIRPVDSVRCARDSFTVGAEHRGMTLVYSLKFPPRRYIDDLRMEIVAHKEAPAVRIESEAGHRVVLPLGGMAAIAGGRVPDFDFTFP